MTKEQALCQFHNLVGDAITECLCGGDITRKDILEADLWTPNEIADLVEELLTKKAEDDN